MAMCWSTCAPMKPTEQVAGMGIPLAEGDAYAPLFINQERLASLAEGALVLAASLQQLIG